MDKKARAQLSGCLGLIGWLVLAGCGPATQASGLSTQMPAPVQNDLPEDQDPEHYLWTRDSLFMALVPPAFASLREKFSNAAPVIPEAEQVLRMGRNWDCVEVMVPQDYGVFGVSTTSWMRLKSYRFRKRLRPSQSGATVHNFGKESRSTDLSYQRDGLVSFGSVKYDGGSVRNYRNVIRSENEGNLIVESSYEIRQELDIPASSIATPERWVSSYLYCPTAGFPEFDRYKKAIE